MRVLIDIGHPAHVHFFRHPLRILGAAGAQALVTSRVKEVALDLLDELGIPHVTLSAQRPGLAALARELALRDYRLWRVVREFRPDVMAAIGGTFIAHVGAITGIPSLVFYDTENARLQNAITYPLAHRVIVPRCYGAWTPAGRTLRYAGYHELSYLRPGCFVPDRAVAIAQGLAPDRPTFLVRLVSWQANHDVGERGWTAALAGRVVERLAAHGAVLISSEGALPPALEPYRYRGRPGLLHHVMAFCRGFVGESATMASECAVLGVPAVYAAHTGRGYTDEQEQRYGLVRNVRELRPEALEAAVDWLLAFTDAARADARARLLADTIDVARFVADTVAAGARGMVPVPSH
ncbi:MAG: DUF354 domain-containing protein [Gammaproteobacteria bacterium]